MPRKRILSGMRPTGRLHLGHLVGALENWVKLQDEYECYFMVADWHALIDMYDRPKEARGAVLDMVADWIACGIDPERSTIFVQSEIPEHLELAWILGCLSPIPWLERCPTFKEKEADIKSRRAEVLARRSGGSDEAEAELKWKDELNYAFLGYPVLQTSDIILYRANAVPVGEDQVPHIELARELTRRFNGKYAEVFPEPQALLTPISRLAGLDGQKKMSKSIGNTLELGEEAVAIKKKAQGMFTDPLRIKKTDLGHPDDCNVWHYYRAFKADVAPRRHTECATAQIGCTDCKREMGERLAEMLAPVREKRQALLADPGKLEGILRDGTERARKTARETMRAVREAMGF